VFVATDALDRIQGALLIQSPSACTAAGPSIKKVLPDIDTLLKTPAPRDLVFSKAPLVARVQGQRATTTLQLYAQSNTARLDTVTSALRLPPMAGAGVSPFGQTKTSGLATLLFRLKGPELGPWVGEFFSRVPGGAGFLKAAQALTPLLSGNAALLIDRVEVKGRLGTERQRFFALKFALVAEVTDDVKAQAIAKTLPQAQVSFPEGTLSAGVNGRIAFFSNDASALKTLTEAAAAGPQAHSIEFAVNGPTVAKGLAQIPLLEVLQTPELAALVGANAELGPLLVHSKELYGWAEKSVGTSHTAQVRWSLDERN
jgi:hypothetical protein